MLKRSCWSQTNTRRSASNKLATVAFSNYPRMLEAVSWPVFAIYPTVVQFSRTRAGHDNDRTLDRLRRLGRLHKTNPPVTRKVIRSAFS